MQVASIVNELYNQQLQLTDPDQPTDIESQTKQGLDIYEKSKTFVQIALKQSDYLREEIDKLYSKIDTLTIDIPTCIEFFGFK